MAKEGKGEKGVKVGCGTHRDQPAWYMRCDLYQLANDSQKS